MTSPVPPAPEFGEPLPLQRWPEALAFLARRRSASALTLTAPGPTGDELDDLFRLAMRVPDHGKLFPWRFVVIEGEAKAKAEARLMEIAEARADAPKARAALGKFNAPPLAVAVVSRVTQGDIPEWEQVLSGGAACLTLLNAASAMGYGANWITDWYSYDEAARPVFGLDEAERVLGFVYIGTASEAPLERVRPDPASRVTRL